MKKRGAVALVLSLAGIGGLAASPAVAQTGPITKTFSFIAAPGQPAKGKVIVNLDGLTINARCNPAGEPVIYAFSSGDADLFGHIFDGYGRLSAIKQSRFTKSNKGVLLSVNNGDFDASGQVDYETWTGKVVTVQYGFDNSTTLNNRKVCTVYGSAVAS